jgi:predicted transcriptional regulator
MPNSATTSLKLDSELKERVQQLAKARRRTAHWIMREAVEQYVSREEKREQFRQDALAAWNEYRATGAHITADEADKWLAKLNTLPSPISGEDDFFASQSIAELAAMQKVKTLKDLSVLAGGIPDDEDVDELVDEIYAARR